MYFAPRSGGANIAGITINSEEHEILGVILKTETLNNSDEICGLVDPSILQVDGVDRGMEFPISPKNTVEFVQFFSERRVLINFRNGMSHTDQVRIIVRSPLSIMDRILTKDLVLVMITFGAMGIIISVLMVKMKKK